MDALLDGEASFRNGPTRVEGHPVVAESRHALGQFDLQVNFPAVRPARQDRRQTVGGNLQLVLPDPSPRIRDGLVAQWGAG